ncbi:hypothetical protein EYF80_049987 [Liparis tanakae]|uniref:Uncharacterized protein n=1 Tax=Liparis tanakae TaxID=230148 RepID=A0A4Z2FF24_9TELE|nr:hypothetical protein EYF80_049987 [Liparis tanakae]
MQAELQKGHLESPDEHMGLPLVPPRPVRMFPVGSEPNRPSSCKLRFRPMVPRRPTVPCSRGRVFLGNPFCSTSTQRLSFSFSAAFDTQLYASGSCWYCEAQGSGFSLQLVVEE